MSNLAISVEKVWKEYAFKSNEGNPQSSLKELLNNVITRNTKINKSKFYALQDVSFTINQGESVGIVGKNGAGKSTLLKILSRITRPSKGKVILYGRVNSLLEVGTGFNTELSGRDNIFLNGSFLGMKYKEIKEKYSEIVEFSEIGKFIDTPVKYYSSGMYVRLAFSVAVHLSPEILLLDEVLSVGDAGFMKKSKDKMIDLLSSGATIVFVSHSEQSIVEICDRVIWIDEGKIKQDGQARDIVKNYLTFNK